MSLEWTRCCRQRRELKSDLRAASKRASSSSPYQPVVDVETGEIATVEALVRWNHPTRGLLYPVRLITIAEETGLIVPIGEWVLRHACYEAANWPQHIRLAVNFSPVQFKARNLVSLIVSALASAGLPPERLEIEITESLLLRQPKKSWRYLTGWMRWA